ncbi:hypothetical protein V8V91_11490 [Algoriphagus halophilus]|uniref:hypothetical protein n=1 Tax=Algoriphagus halophilus TaxID=226505 RepID=UPI0035902B1A
MEVDPEPGADYTIQFFGTKKSAPEESGRLLEEVSGIKADFMLEADDMYVRAKIISSKPKENPYQLGDTEVAWTQPVVTN